MLFNLYDFVLLPLLLPNQNCMIVGTSLVRIPNSKIIVSLIAGRMTIAPDISEYRIIKYPITKNAESII